MSGLGESRATKGIMSRALGCGFAYNIVRSDVLSVTKAAAGRGFSDTWVEIAGAILAGLRRHVLGKGKMV